MVTIDGYNIADHGFTLLKDGYSDLFCYPERKAPVSNDWFEQDGLDVDLDEVYFNARKITLKFHLNAFSTDAFVASLTWLETLLLSSSRREVYLSVFDVTWNLRYVASNSFSLLGGLIRSGKKSADFALEFVEDNPLESFVNLAAVGAQLPATHVSMNDIDLSAYGIVVKRIYDSALSPAEAKQGLSRQFDRYTGNEQDVGFTGKKSLRKISIELFMKGANVPDFMANYNALWQVLSTPEKKLLRINGNMNYDCYYMAAETQKNVLTTADMTIQLYAYKEYLSEENFIYTFTGNAIETFSGSNISKF